MLQVNLSTLSGPELRRLLDTTRERGEAALSYQILQEMAARREQRGRRSLLPTRRPSEPRIIAVDLGDPMDPEDDVPPLPAGLQPGVAKAEPRAAAPVPPEPDPVPAPRRSRQRKAQSEPIVEPEPAPMVLAEVEPLPEPQRPRSVWDAEPEASSEDAGDEDLRLSAPEPHGPRARSRVGRGTAMGFAAGIAAGIAVGWWAGGITRPEPPTPTTAAAPIQTAALPPRPSRVPPPIAPAVAAPEPAPQAPPEPAAGPPPSELLTASPALSPDAPEAAVDAAVDAMELPPPRKAEAATAVARAPAGTDACAAKRTPADRAICADPELRGLQRELQQAYAEALEAHEERGLLRQRQLAWRDARNTVSDPDRLARLYEERIRKLNSATEAARRER